MEFTFKNGAVFNISELTLGDMSALRDYVKGRKIAMIKSAFKDSAELTGLLMKTVSTAITDAEISDSMQELGTIVYLLHRSISKTSKDITIEQVADAIAINDMAQMPVIMGVMMGASASPPAAPAVMP